jgi:hypothetical protein
MRGERRYWFTSFVSERSDHARVMRSTRGILSVTTWRREVGCGFLGSDETARS